MQRVAGGAGSEYSTLRITTWAVIMNSKYFIYKTIGQKDVCSDATNNDLCIYKFCPVS